MTDAESACVGSTILSDIPLGEPVGVVLGCALVRRLKTSILARWQTSLSEMRACVRLYGFELQPLKST